MHVQLMLVFCLYLQGKNEIDATIGRDPRPSSSKVTSIHKASNPILVLKVMFYHNSHSICLGFGNFNGIKVQFLMKHLKCL